MDRSDSSTFLDRLSIRTSHCPPYHHITRLSMHSSAIPTLALLVSGTAAAAWGPSHGGYPPSHGKPPCSEAVVALATGIHINIIGQYAEFNGTEFVKKVETEQAGNTTAFLLAKGQLEADIQGGMNIRLFNQEIAPPGNPAIPGLTKYANAQEAEKALVAGLTGDYAVDKKAIDTLMSDIMTGIQLNKNNTAAVSVASKGGCYRLCTDVSRPFLSARSICSTRPPTKPAREWMYRKHPLKHHDGNSVQTRIPRVVGIVICIMMCTYNTPLPQTNTRK